MPVIGIGPSCKLTSRLEKRMEALQRVKLGGYAAIVTELETELNYWRRAERYLAE
jgi:hypothetical protein